VRRFVFVSSTGVYAQQDGSWVDEDTPAEPREFSDRALLDGERAVLGGPLPATVLRLGGIYGPGRTRLIESVRRGEARVRPGLYTNRIHRDDAAGALAHLLALAEPAPVYLGVDDEPAAEADVLNWIADRLGLPRPPASRAVPHDRLEHRGNKRCRNARLRGSGYGFRYPTFREGYASLMT
jgi:nucleoside-diphosphate-sugar epimerase